MDITEVILLGPPVQALSEEDIKQRFQRYGLISSIKLEPSKQQAVVSFLSAISANRAYHSQEEEMRERDIVMEYDKPQPQEPVPVDTNQQVRQQIYKPYTYKKFREQQSQQNWTEGLQGRKGLVLLAVVALFILWLTVYRPLTAVKKRHRRKPTHTKSPAKPDKAVKPRKK